MKENTTLKIAAIAGISAITIANICMNHVDGAFAAAMCGIIGGIVGYTIKKG